MKFEPTAPMFYGGDFPPKLPICLAVVKFALVFIDNEVTIKPNAFRLPHRHSIDMAPHATF